jgi:hypothetical protein
MNLQGSVDNDLVEAPLSFVDIQKSAVRDTAAHPRADRFKIHWFPCTLHFSDKCVQT